MDERQRKIFERAYAILDRREADEREHVRWLEGHVDKYGILDLGQDEEIEQPPPPPPQQTSFQLTDAQILRLIDDRVAKSSIAPQVNQALDVVAKALDNLHKMNELHEKKIVELEKQNAALRDDIEFLRVAKGNRVEMITRSNRDVA